MEDLDTELARNEAHEQAELGEPDYLPDPRLLWGAEGARAMLVVLTRRLGPEFAREVSNEIASRTLGYQAGCPDDQSDGEALDFLLRDKFWDALFASEKAG